MNLLKLNTYGACVTVVNVKHYLKTLTLIYINGLMCKISCITVQSTYIMFTVPPLKVPLFKVPMFKKPLFKVPLFNLVPMSKVPLFKVPLFKVPLFKVPLL